jgi:hypothetical protein
MEAWIVAGLIPIKSDFEGHVLAGDRAGIRPGYADLLRDADASIPAEVGKAVKVSCGGTFGNVAPRAYVVQRRLPKSMTGFTAGLPHRCHTGPFQRGRKYRKCLFL